MYLFSFHLLIYCIYTSPNFNKGCPTSSSPSEHLPAEEPHMQSGEPRIAGKEQWSTGMHPQVNIFPDGVQLCSSISFQKVFPGATVAISCRSWSAARHAWLWCSSASPEQQEYRTQHSLGSAGDRRNTVPSKFIPQTARQRNGAI